MPSPGNPPWREEILPRTVAAVGAVLLVLLAWKLASGISRFVFVDDGQSPRIQVVFSARRSDAIPVMPPPLPAAPQATTATAVDDGPPTPPARDAAAPPRPDAPVAVIAPTSPGLFDEDGRPRLPTGQSDRWNRPPAAVPGSAATAPADAEAARRLLDRPNPVQVQGTRFARDWKTDGDAAEVVAQEIFRAQRKIAEFLFGKDIEHARARPSPDIAFNPLRHSRQADLGSEATGDEYKAAPISYQPAPGLDGEASRRIREQVIALETGYARCDRARLRELMQPLLLHLDELQKAETAYARGADPVRAEHMLPNVANNAYDMARRALWYADSRMAGCDG